MLPQHVGRAGKVPSLIVMVSGMQLFQGQLNHLLFAWVFVTAICEVTLLSITFHVTHTRINKHIPHYSYQQIQNPEVQKHRSILC